MVTNEAQKFLFDYFKNLLYNRQKLVIEKTCENIEDSKIRQDRVKLLKYAEISSTKHAKILTKSITDEQIQTIFKSYDVFNSSKINLFGTNMYKEIMKDLE